MAGFCILLRLSPWGSIVTIAVFVAVHATPGYHRCCPDLRPVQVLWEIINRTTYHLRTNRVSNQAAILCTEGNFWGSVLDESRRTVVEMPQQRICWNRFDGHTRTWVKQISAVDQRKEFVEVQIVRIVQI